MKKLQFNTFASALLSGLVALAACAAEDDPAGTGDTDTESNSGTSTSTGTTSTTDATSTTSGTSGTTSGTTTTGDTDDTTTTTTTGGTEPDGAECTSNDQCESGSCYVIPLLGGICGECASEDDCSEGGCTPPNPLADPALPSVCNMGELGGGCDTDAACQEDLSCIDFIDVPNIVTLSTCGECVTDADCSDGQLCAPQIDVAAFSGQRSCVDPMSVPAGQGCDHEGSGDMQCQTDLICAEINIMDLLTFGLCGDCEVNADCDVDGGEECLEADVDLDTGVVTPPTCGVPA